MIEVHPEVCFTLARKLYVSEATIKSHLAHIYTKLEVDTRAAAVARAIEQRIIRPEVS